MLLGKFDNISLLSILIVMMYGINQIDAKEFINDELNIKFEYPDEWKSTPLSRQAATFGIEYDQVPIVSLDVDPKPPIFNFLMLTAYTNMANLDQFEKSIRQKLLTDETVNHDILDINTYVQNDSRIPFVYIKTLYTPILKDLPIVAPTVKRDYLLFHKDNTGNEIMFSLTPDLETKYADNLHNIIKQIKGNVPN